MSRKNSDRLNIEQKQLSILFVGDAGRGKRLQEAFKSSHWKFTFKTETILVLDKYDLFNPDIVILDRFPESNLAKSVFYHFRENRYRYNKKISFIALNALPGAAKFSHLNCLSFLRMIHRDSKPEILINEIASLVRSNHELHTGDSDLVYQHENKTDNTLERYEPSAEYTDSGYIRPG